MVDDSKFGAAGTPGSPSQAVTPLPGSATSGASGWASAASSAKSHSTWGARAPQDPSSEPLHPMADSSLNRFLGGSPAAVFIRLLVLSLIVGALLLWLDIRPEDILRGVERFITRLYNLGFGAIRDIVNYIIAGAVIVVPVWLVLRLLNTRNSR